MIKTITELQEMFPGKSIEEIYHNAVAVDVVATYTSVVLNECHAGKDGDCIWPECPQLKDGEPAATGRTCPLWKAQTDE